MPDCRILGAENDKRFETLYGTHPAAPDTQLVYAFRGGGSHREVVVLWGVLADGSPVPITLDGVWGGTDQPNQFVRFPNGHCGRFEQSWPSEIEAMAELGEREPS